MEIHGEVKYFSEYPLNVEKSSIWQSTGTVQKSMVKDLGNPNSVTPFFLCCITEDCQARKYCFLGCFHPSSFSQI